MTHYRTLRLHEAQGLVLFLEPGLGAHERL